MGRRLASFGLPVRRLVLGHDAPADAPPLEKVEKPLFRDQFTDKINPQGRAKRLAFLAPLAGYSDLPFRQICHKEGSLLGTTELVSAAGIRYSGYEKSWRYLAIDLAQEGPVLIQLFGSEPEDFLFAADQILSHPVLSLCVGIDLNMGCPVPKVVKTGAGSALLNTPAKAAEIVRRLATLLHPAGYWLGCKIRRGFAMDEEVAPALAVKLAEAGADILTIHGRYRDQYYSGQADWGVISRAHDSLAKAALRHRVLLVANGDITSASSADACLLETSADAVSVGRAAQGNPWLFRELVGDGDGDGDVDGAVDAVRVGGAAVSLAEKSRTILKHAEHLAEFLGEDTAMREFRKTLAAYAQGHPNAKKLRLQGGQVSSLDDVKIWLSVFQS